MRQEYEVIEFNSATDLGKIGMGAPAAVARDVFVGSRDKLQDASEYVAIWNDDAEKLACIASKKYAIIQHRDVVESFVKSIQSVGLNVKGELVFQEHGNVMRISAFFQDHRIQDDAQGIDLGIRITNSYDSTLGLRGDVWGMRLVCSNGMKIPGFETAYKRIHIGRASASEGMVEFLKIVVEKKPQIMALVEENIKAQLDLDKAVIIVKKLVPQKKHQKKLLEDLEEFREKPFTKWELYNVLTSYSTHGKLAPAAEDMIQRVAQSVLTRKEESLLKVKVAPVTG